MSFSFERRSLIVVRSEGVVERVGMGGGVETLSEGVRAVTSGIIGGNVGSAGEGWVSTVVEGGMFWVGREVGLACVVVGEWRVISAITTDA